MDPSRVSSFEENDHRSISLAMIHFAPKLIQSIEDLDTNTRAIERAMRKAKRKGVNWMMTPELALTGYKFNSTMGSSWIMPGPDRWTRYLQEVADSLNMVLFLSHLEKDEASGEIFNTLFAINTAGEIVGRHRKINTIPGAESWSTPGNDTQIVTINSIKIGMLICADAWPQEHAKRLKELGAELILSPANWPPGGYGPGNTWENRSQETGLPLLVNNRNGIEKGFDMSNGASVVVLPNGNSAKRIFEHRSSQDQVIKINLSLRDLNLNDVSVFDI